jgi:chemotaxis protein methyltransferase CheR
MIGTKSNIQELKAEDFVAIRDFIHERSGIFFAENKKYIVENRLSKRMADLGVKNYKDYFYLIKYDTSQKEFNTLMNLITTNETSFFRNPPQLKAFSDEVLPLIVKEKEVSKQRKLRIWSAGCSTGEEPYTLSIILLEKIRDAASWQIEILANDISEQVLYAARTGVYNDMSLRSTERFIIEKYFTREPEGYRVSDDVKRLVKLSHMNLTDFKKMAMFKDIDILFCRNVMIYFSDDVKRNIVRHFYGSLRPGGYFFIGHSESLHGISKSFKLAYFKNALVYQKEASATAAAAAVSERREAVSERTQSTLRTLEAMQKLLASKR